MLKKLHLSLVATMLFTSACASDDAASRDDAPAPAAEEPAAEEPPAPAGAILRLNIDDGAVYETTTTTARTGLDGTVETMQMVAHTTMSQGAAGGLVGRNKVVEVKMKTGEGEFQLAPPPMAKMLHARIRIRPHTPATASPVPATKARSPMPSRGARA